MHIMREDHKHVGARKAATMQHKATRQDHRQTTAHKGTQTLTDQHTTSSDNMKHEKFAANVILQKVMRAPNIFLNMQQHKANTIAMPHVTSNKP